LNEWQERLRSINQSIRGNLLLKKLEVIHDREHGIYDKKSKKKKKREVCPCWEKKKRLIRLTHIESSNTEGPRPGQAWEKLKRERLPGQMKRKKKKVINRSDSYE
jgi:hypothetical protein